MSTASNVGAGAAVAGGFAFPPMLLPLLLAFGPAALSKILGHDPQADLRKKIEALMHPDNIGKLTNSLYQQNLGSPAYSQGLRTIAAGGNSTGNLIASELGQRGIGTSGTGAVLSSLVPSIVGKGQADLRTSAYNAAHETALSQIQQRIAMLTGTSGPSQTQKLFAGGLESFGPMFNNWLMNQYPQFRPQPVPAR